MPRDGAHALYMFRRLAIEVGTHTNDPDRLKRPCIDRGQWHESTSVEQLNRADTRDVVIEKLRRYDGRLFVTYRLGNGRRVKVSYSADVYSTERQAAMFLYILGWSGKRVNVSF